MHNKDEHAIVEWDQLTKEDQFKAEQLLKELNAIMDNYIPKDKSEKISPKKN